MKKHGRERNTLSTTWRHRIKQLNTQLLLFIIFALEIVLIFILVSISPEMFAYGVIYVFLKFPYLSAIILYVPAWLSHATCGSVELECFGYYITYIYIELLVVAILVMTGLYTLYWWVRKHNEK